MSALPMYQEDHGEARLPDALVDDVRHRFIPIAADKTAYVSGPEWQAGFTFRALMDHVKAGTWPLWCNSPKNLGVRLDVSGLVVIDCDVTASGGTDPRFICQRAGALYTDGRAELGAWLKECGIKLPRTLMLKTAGRPDGSHLPGWHLYYRQNPAWTVFPGNLTQHVEVKAKGIARISTDFEVLVDHQITVLPVEVAKLVQPAGSLTPRGPREARSGSRNDSLADYAQAGVNNALTAIKGLIAGSGWWTEEQANQAVVLLNSLLDEPIDDRRLNGTVLRPKGWTA